MEFRKITEQDLSAYLAMAEAFYHSPAVLSSIPAENIRGTAQECLKGTPFADIFLFFEQEQCLGYGLLAYTYSQEAGGKVVWIEEIYLKPEARGRGAGTAFLEFVENHIPARRYRLEAEPDNDRAIKLYRREEFSELGYISYTKDSGKEAP